MNVYVQHGGVRVGFCLSLRIAVFEPRPGNKLLLFYTIVLEIVIQVLVVQLHMEINANVSNQIHCKMEKSTRKFVAYQQI